MKNTYKVTCLLLIALTGCAGTQTSPSQSVKKNSGDELQRQVNVIQKKLNDCIAKANQSDDAKFVDAHVISLTANNPNAQELFNSSEKINSEQAVILTRFKDSTLACRIISDEFPKPALVSVYADFYKSVDAVYADLLSKRVTIGVANQERAMRIQYAKSQWVEAMQKL
jgi:hypothetical protein